MGQVENIHLEHVVAFQSQLLVAVFLPLLCFFFFFFAHPCIPVINCNACAVQ